VSGVPVTVLRASSRFQLDAAVFDGKLALSTTRLGSPRCTAAGPG